MAAGRCSLSKALLDPADAPLGDIKGRGNWRMYAGFLATCPFAGEARRNIQPYEPSWDGMIVRQNDAKTKGVQAIPFHSARDAVYDLCVYYTEKNKSL